MTLREFQHTAAAVLAGATRRRDLQHACGMASCLADMVGWAPGSIDAGGEVHASLERLRSAARRIYESHRVQEAAVLHDAIADLMEAIVRHDRDLRPGSGVGEEEFDG